jgi:hypothetical protein
MARCKCKTLDGKQCKRKAEPGYSYCWQHLQNRSITNSCNSTRKSKKRHPNILSPKYEKYTIKYY